MSTKVVHLVAAARPNFMKVAPLYHALKKADWCNPVVVWMRQHEDDRMSGSFLVELNVPNEDIIRRPVGEGTHASQTAAAMLHYSEVCSWNLPDAVVVPGDVNTSMACALVGVKLGVPVVHLEAGLRSFDRSMPEEINRVVTDSVSDLLLTPSEDADDNLAAEGIFGNKVARVGNIMIDAFEMLRPKIEAVPKREGPYAVITLHRPSNVDSRCKLDELMAAARRTAREIPVVFPVHPRTKKRLQEFGLHGAGRIEFLDPLRYVDFMGLVKGATIVITDSGGVQEEASHLGIPCATVRDNTERPTTITHGTNKLIAPRQIVQAALDALAGRWKKGASIPLWDGHTAERAVKSLENFLGVS